VTSFQAPVQDILFSMRDVAGAAALADWDEALAGDILAHFGAFAEEVVAPLDAVGDAQGARLENGRVIMPDGFREAYAQLAEGGWQGLTAPEELGGMGLSKVVGAGVSEIFSGANHSMQMVCNLVPGAISTLLKFGSSAQQEEWIPRLASGEVLSTMCLTEASAGSDLSVIRCRATPKGEQWVLDGEKIFISGGDQNLSASILHLVLARSGPIEEGIKSLSLFLCPAQLGVRVERLEEKLGLHASPTCQLVFDGAEAELIGQEGRGLQAMFAVMNHARLDVALQGVAHAARARDISRRYADERVQGRTSDGSPARLSDHADVARMLDEQRQLELGARAMCHITLVELERGQRPELIEFLTPICKVFCSEAGIRAADLGIQILGGYGYLTEYRIAQTWRDARITAIYEGANGIHERALTTRGLRAGGGSDLFEDLIRELADGSEPILNRLELWQVLRDTVRDADDASILAHDFSGSTADLLFAAAWARILKVCEHRPDQKYIRRLGQFVLAPVAKT
jgi:alkylation response protein AidB-like acyl-CoA dehydrogenase